MTGYFALVGLVRLYAKIGDYASAIEAARPLNALGGDGIYTRNLRCHATLAHYLGFSLTMVRRYEDALKLFSRVLSHFARANNVFGDAGSSSGGSMNTLVRKISDKMLALAAVCSAVLPGAAGIDDTVRKAVQARYQGKIDVLLACAETSASAAAPAAAAPGAAAGAAAGPAGAAVASGSNGSDLATADDSATRDAITDAEKVLDDLFDYACPGFLSLSLDRPSSAPGDDGMMSVHRGLFRLDIIARLSGFSGELRSFLRLYTTIDVQRLAGYVKKTPDEVRASLTALKVRAWQTGPSPIPSTAVEASLAMPMDPLHFFLQGDNIVAEETRAKANAIQFFVRSIEFVSKFIRDEGYGGKGQRGGRKR
jgi:translation initiation factor 3 subunit L